MFATELIGKRAIRTGQCVYPSGAVSLSFTDEPILILHATDHHIVYKRLPESHIYKMCGDKTEILNLVYCDDKWISYDDLMEMAKPLACCRCLLLRFKL